MKNMLFLIFLNCFVLNMVSAQVYLSTSFEEVVLIGSENVSCKGKTVAANHLLEIDSLAGLLRSTLRENASELKDLKEKKKLNKKKEARLESLNNENTQISNELIVLNEFYRLWKTVYANHTLLGEFYLATKDGKCFEITTESGTYQPADYEVKMEGNANGMLCNETIPIEEVELVTKWVKKKKDGPCLSADPNDCLVWCMEGGPEAAKFIGYNNIEYNLDNCPLGFTYQHESSACIRAYEVIMKDNSVQPISLIRKSDYQPLVLRSWVETTCE